LVTHLVRDRPEAKRRRRYRSLARVQKEHHHFILATNHLAPIVRHPTEGFFQFHSNGSAYTSPAAVHLHDHSPSLRLSHPASPIFPSPVKLKKSERGWLGSHRQGARGVNPRVSRTSSIWKGGSAFRLPRGACIICLRFGPVCLMSLPTDLGARRPAGARMRAGGGHVVTGPPRRQSVPFPFPSSTPSASWRPSAVLSSVAMGPSSPA
jgi:hypothetical protein